MDYLVSYDIATPDRQGERRLRRVAKVCEAFGQRVQYSVFECSLSEAELEMLLCRLDAIIDPQQDRLRVYRLRGGRRDSVIVRGLDGYVDFSGPLLV